MEVDKVGMKRVGALIGVVVSATLTGCAVPQPEQIDSAKLQNVKNNGLIVDQVVNENAVVIKSKGQAVGGMVIGSVLGSVIGSTMGGQTLQSMQVAQSVGQQTGANVQTAISLYDQKVQQPTTPAVATRDELARALDQAGIRSGPNAYHIRIDQKSWILSYDNMFGKDDYRIHYALVASVIDENGKIVTRSDCAGVSTQAQALDVWQAQDYAPIAAYAAEVGKTCSKKLLDELGVGL